MSLMDRLSIEPSKSVVGVIVKVGVVELAISVRELVAVMPAATYVPSVIVTVPAVRPVMV
jgi:hypothetical protein